MPLPTIADALARIFGSLGPFWSVIDGFAAAVKAALPGFEAEIDAALAKAKADAEAGLNSPLALAQVDKALAELTALRETLLSEAPADPGDLLG